MVSHVSSLAQFWVLCVCVCCVLVCFVLLSLTALGVLGPKIGSAAASFEAHTALSSSPSLHLSLSLSLLHLVQQLWAILRQM